MKQKILAIFIGLLATMSMQAQNKLIYVGDPMCSWCYGFAPQLDQLITQYQGTLELELVTGGLRPYNQQSIQELKEFLRVHWQEVHNQTQQAFNYDMLDRTDLLYDTEPACRAVVVVRTMAPAKEFDFFRLIQKAFYAENKYLGEVASYYSILNDLDIDKKIFEEKFLSVEYKALVKKDFERAAALGVGGFPSVLLQTKDELIVLSRGYTTAKHLEALITQALKK